MGEKKLTKAQEAQQQTMALIEKMKSQKVNPFSTTESQEAMFISNEKSNEYKLPVKRPKFYSDPKIKQKV